MEEKKFEPRDVEKLQKILQSGEEISIQGTQQMGNVKIADGKVLSDSLDYDGNRIVERLTDRYGNQYGRAFMLLKDKFGQSYLMRHILQFSKQSNSFISICRSYDLMTNDDVDRYEMVSKRNGWGIPKVEPVILLSRGKEVKEHGLLWLAENQYTITNHKTNLLPIPSDIELPFKDIDADVYLHIFSTANYAYDRGLGKNAMERVEGIIARLQADKPRIKFVGSMVPLDLRQRYKAKVGEKGKEMFDEYGQKRVDDCYCALATIYSKLGFSVTPVFGIAGRSPEGNKSSTHWINATVLSKEIDSKAVNDSGIVSKHFANPLKYDEDEM